MQVGTTRMNVVHIPSHGDPSVLRVVDLPVPESGPGEVLVRIHHAGLCHSDVSVLNGTIPFPPPVVLGHEGAGIVREVGAGVTSVQPGDHVIPLYTPECRECYSCLSRKTNLCTSIRATQGQGVMPDGTSRFSCVSTGGSPAGSGAAA